MLRHTNATVFTTNKPPGNAATLDVVARIQGRVVVVVNLACRCTCVKCAVKRLDLSRPELEVTGGVITIARESNLGRSARKHVQDFPV